MRPPTIEESTKQQREQYIRETYPCHSDCDNCGICKVFHGKTAEIAYADYIEGKRDFMEVTMDYR